LRRVFHQWLQDNSDNSFVASIYPSSFAYCPYTILEPRSLASDISRSHIIYNYT